MRMVSIDRIQKNLALWHRQSGELRVVRNGLDALVRKINFLPAS
jgi:hypothetical protein